MMKFNWPTTVEELVDECEKLKSRYDLYTLGEKGEPFQGESETRVDGTHYLAGEYQYGVAMIPAQWVTHVLSANTEPDVATGARTCTIVKTWTDSDYADHWRYSCSECGYRIEVGERDVATGNPTSHANFCWNCGRKVVDE